MGKARELGRKRFLKLLGDIIEIDDSNFKIEFQITRWLYWGLQWIGKDDYLKYYFRARSTSATGHRYDWTSSQDLALLLYLFPLVHHLTYYHKLYVKQKALRAIRRAYEDSERVNAHWALATAYGKTKCAELRKLRAA